MNTAYTSPESALPSVLPGGLPQILDPPDLKQHRDDWHRMDLVTLAEIDQMSKSQLRNSLSAHVRLARRLRLEVEDSAFQHRCVTQELTNERTRWQLEKAILTKDLAEARKACDRVFTTARVAKIAPDGGSNASLALSPALSVPQMPVFFKDCLSRNFQFPWKRCRSRRASTVQSQHLQPC